MSLSVRGFFMWKGRPSVLADTPPFSEYGSVFWSRKMLRMVLFFPVALKILFRKGRNYAWPRPDGCPRCAHDSVWGHGFVAAIFDGYDQLLLLKLYRCPDCGCVIRLRPVRYFKRFQAPIETIRSSIAFKSTSNRWLPGISRSRQRHWYRSLFMRIKAYLTDIWCQGVVAGFDSLLRVGQSPVSRSI